MSNAGAGAVMYWFFCVKCIMVRNTKGGRLRYPA